MISRDEVRQQNPTFGKSIISQAPPQQTSQVEQTKRRTSDVFFKMLKSH